MPERRKMNKLTFGRQKFNGADRLAPPVQKRENNSAQNKRRYKGDEYPIIPIQNITENKGAVNLHPKI